MLTNIVGAISTTCILSYFVCAGAPIYHAASLLFRRVFYVWGTYELESQTRKLGRFSRSLPAKFYRE